MVQTRHCNQRPFDQTLCDGIITNGGVKNSSKKVQNVYDDGCIKHISVFNCVYNAGHTVQFNELFAMRRNKRNGQPDEGVCDIHHMVQSDELFVMRRNKRNGQPDEGVCDIQHTVHLDELFVTRRNNRNEQLDKGVCD